MRTPVIFLNDIRQGRRFFLIWTGGIAAMLLICIFMFPEMKNQMQDVSDLFAGMGGFTDAFGMDAVNFGELMGFYGIECGNTVSFGGAFFAALLGAGILSREETGHTAEFLLTHPVSRTSIARQKLCAVLSEIVVLNVTIAAVALLAMYGIGETPAVGDFILLHTALLAMQLEIACLCFGLSVFVTRGCQGIAIGLSIALYFMNIIANITDSARFLSYITPFGYADASDILSSGSLSIVRLLIGLLFAAAALTAGFLRYRHRDIAG